MAVATASTTIKVHNFPTGRVEHHYHPSSASLKLDDSNINGPIRSISWSKNGNWLALVPYNGCAEIISIKNQLKQIHKIESFAEPSCVAFQNTTKKNLAIGTRNGQVYLYDIKSSSVKKTFTKSLSMVTQIEFSAKDNYIVANYLNGQANLFSNVTNTLVSVLRMPKQHCIYTLKTNPIKRNLIVGGSRDGAVCVWDINTNKTRFFNETIHKAPICSTIFSPIHTDLILTTALDRQFCFYDIQSNQLIKTVSVDNCMLSADFSNDGRYIIMGSQNGRVYVYDSRKLDESMNYFIAHNSSIKHLAFQKCQDSNNEVSLISSSLEVVRVEQQEEEEEQQQQQQEQSFNIGYISVESPLVPMNEQQSKQQIDYDSFMAKIGLDQHEMFKSIDNNDDVEKNNGDKSVSQPSLASPQLSIHTNHLEEIVKGNQQQSSTPVTGTTKASIPFLTVQPIKTTTECKCNINDISSLRNIVKDELNAIVDNLKTEMKFKWLDLKDDIRNVQLSLMMLLVKQSIKIEDLFEKYCNNNNNNGVLQQNYETLYEENVVLKENIANLEQRLACMKILLDKENIGDQ